MLRLKDMVASEQHEQQVIAFFVISLTALSFNLILLLEQMDAATVRISSATAVQETIDALSARKTVLPTH